MLFWEYCNMTNEEILLEYNKLKQDYVIFDQNRQDRINAAYNIMLKRDLVRLVSKVKVSWTKFGF